MTTPQTQTETGTPGQASPAASRTMRRGWSVELVGMSCALLTLATVGAALVWTNREAGRLAIAGERSAVQMAARTLAPAAAALVQRNDLTGLQSLVRDAAAAAGDGREIAVMLPDGAVLAHSDPKRVTVLELPDSWGAPKVAGSGPLAEPPGMVLAQHEAQVSGRGPVLVEVTARQSGGFVNEAATGLIAIGVVGIGLCLVLLQRASVVVRPLRAIQEALREAAAGEQTQASLAVSPRWGAEAAAWNALLAEREELRAQATERTIEHAAAAGRPGEGLIEGSCDALPHGVIVMDGAGVIRYANGAAAVVLGCKRAEVVGKPCAEVLHDERVAALAKQVAQDGSRRRGSVEVEHGSGEERSVVKYTCCRVTPDGEEGKVGVGGGAVMLIEDLTQQRVADRAREAFVTNATHELRTPLTNIRLYVETLLEDESGDPQLQGKCINVINQEARRLERMVSDMLSVAEIEAGSLKLREGDVRLETLFEELKSDYAAAATEKEITLTFDLPPKLPVLRGDRDKVAMALHNLIGNALKYTPAGGEVTVSLEESATSAVIRVKDNGIGIAPEETERVFDKFYRSRDKRVGRITGTGLGLALAREVARLHGGDITVESQLDRGSTFTMVLPLGAQGAGAPAAAAAAPVAKAA
jgi:PAS domain S-box-containing protein